MRRLDLTGQRFGRLVPRYAVSIRCRNRSIVHWVCQCDCGKEATIVAHRLTAKSDPTESCGCLRAEADRNRRLLTPDEETEVVAAYESGQSAADVARCYGMCAGQLLRVVKRNGGHIRTQSECQRAYSLRESAFATVTDSAAYWIGFLMADGCVWRRSGTAILSLGLAAADGGHVESFRDFLGSSHPIYRKRQVTPKSGGRKLEYRVLTVASKVLVDDLSRFGIEPRKSLVAEAKGGVESSRHFWRGVVDGDGSLFESRDVRIKRSGKRYPRVRKNLTLCGSESMMHQFRQYVQRHVETNASVRQTASKIHEFRTVGAVAETIASVLYADCDDYLPRKKAIADRWASSGPVKTAPTGEARLPASPRET